MPDAALERAAHAAGLGVRGLHGSVEIFGRALRLVQTGNLQTYTFLAVVGIIIVLVYALR